MNFRIVRSGLGVFVFFLTLFFFSTSLQAQNDAAGLFKSKCAACHGPDGSAGTPMGKSMKIRDLRSADVQKQTDAQLTDIITNGKGAMPAYKGKITDDKVKQLVGYIRSLADKK